ncbi:hypothetical protein ACM66B_005304 [Microbotryomycetes sp. NB124-2]
MAFGILEPSGLVNPADVLGTGILEETTASQSDALVKHARGRPDLILVPTPSDDPQDPLNWNRARKEAAFATLFLGTTLAGTCGPLVAPAFVEIATDFGRPLSQIAQINGSLVLSIGIGSVLLAPVQTKWGMRPVFLTAALLAVVGQVWAAASKSNYPSLIAARVVQGLGMGAYFNNVPAAIEAIYFVHERGTRMALWNLALIGGINLGPVISSQIVERQGWHFAFWWQAVACSVVLLGTIVFVPELMYDRSYYEAAVLRRHNMLSGVSESLSDDKSDTAGKDAALSKVITAPQELDSNSSSRWSQYRICTGAKTETPFYKLLMQPLYYIYSPTVIWASLTFSVCFNLLPLAATVYGQIFGSSPYNLSVGGIGLVGGLPPLIGTLIGTVMTGPVSDLLAKWLAKRNNGIFEPEFRLITMLFFLVFGGMGFYGWGLQKSDSWVVPAIFIAILHVGVSAATISCFSYVADALREGAADALGLVVLIKSAIGFGITYIINDWYAARGPRQFFVSLASLVVATSGLVIPAWIWGKKARYWFDKHNILSK